MTLQCFLKENIGLVVFLVSRCPLSCSLFFSKIHPKTGSLMPQSHPRTTPTPPRLTKVKVRILSILWFHPFGPHFFAQSDESDVTFLASCVCTASSRVGSKTSAMGPSPGCSCGCAMMWTKAGSRKPNVLPLPGDSWRQLETAGSCVRNVVVGCRKNGF